VDQALVELPLAGEQFERLAALQGGDDGHSGGKDPSGGAVDGRSGTYGHTRARRMKVRVDGELRYDEKLLLVEALNGTYAGGGLKVAPKAKLNDGLLDVFLVRDMPWLKIWALFPKVYWGTHIERERAEYLPVREVEVEAEKSTRVSVDGEVSGYAPARFRVVPGGLKTVCPPETASSQVAKGI
jgi:diacylglycerol kinase family enzyme